jgi:hypothetical protein
LDIDAKEIRMRAGFPVEPEVRTSRARSQLGIGFDAILRMRDRALNPGACWLKPSAQFGTAQKFRVG